MLEQNENFIYKIFHDISRGDITKDLAFPERSEGNFTFPHTVTLETRL